MLMASTVFRVTFIVLGTAALLACTPTYDWRTIQNNDNGYEVTFPAKPHSDGRDIDTGGQTLHMSMQTAEAGDAVFAIGTIDLPNADTATQRATVDFLQHGLAHNLNAAPVVKPVQISIAVGGVVAGEEIDIGGAAANGQKHESRQIQARFVAKDKRVYEVVIVATKLPPADQIDQFFSSFKLF